MNDRFKNRALAVARWAALLCIGALLWLLGLVALDVPIDLPLWRHVCGAAVLSAAVRVWLTAEIRGGND